MKEHESKIWGIVAAILTMILLFLFLWFYYLDAPYVPEEEGIEVAFGDYEEGGAEEFIPSQAEPEIATTATAQAAPSTNDMIVQEDDNTLALQKQAEEKRKQYEAEQARLLKQQQEEAERLERERIAAEQAAREKAAAEKAAKEQAAKDKAARDMAGLFGNNTGSSGSGNSTGPTQQGNPAGNPASAGNSMGGPKVSLVGRSLRGKLAMPNYDVNEEGVVVVNIRVNAEGKVVSATKGQGTNTSSETLINAAINAAKQATFSPASDANAPDVLGTITYNFKNK